MEQASKIILTRKSEWLNRLKSYKVFIDGIESGKIKNGSSEEFTADAGKHYVQCKMNWVSSRSFEVDIKPNEAVYLMIKSGLKFFWIFYILLLAGIVINLYYSFAAVKRPSYSFNIELILILPAALYLLYYLSFGRKDYLVIRKDTKNIFAG